MGRRGGRRGAKRQRTDRNDNRGGERGGDNRPEGDKGAYHDVVKENELFERFYKVGWIAQY